MAKVTDVHVRRLLRLLDQGSLLSLAAAKVGIDRKTARRYWNLKRLPSELPPHARDWRTRTDPFADVWSAVEAQLRAAPGLQAKTLFAWLQRQHPGRFADGQVRTLQRRIHDWQATHGPAQ